MGAKTLPLLRQFDAACVGSDELEAATVAAFASHQDADIITSFPGLGALTGARVLAEMGDDYARFPTARALESYAGSTLVTRSSGRKTTVLARRIKNQRLASAGYIRAFAALTASPGARAHYDRRRSGEERHVAAQRNLFNRPLGCLHHCLARRIPYDDPQHRLTDQPHRGVCLRRRAGVCGHEGGRGPLRLGPVGSTVLVSYLGASLEDHGPTSGTNGQVHSLPDSRASSSPKPLRRPSQIPPAPLPEA